MKLYENIQHNETYIIAEMSANHGGSLDRALEIVHEAKRIGADCLKIQTYTADTLSLNCDTEYFPPSPSGLWKGYRPYDLYAYAYTPWEWQQTIKNECDNMGIDFISSVFDYTSIDFLENIGVEMYKIASPEMVDLPMIKYAAAKGKPMIMSCGLATKQEIFEAVEACHSVGNDHPILLKCTSEYPTKYEEMDLSQIPVMKELYQTPIGLSDHSMGCLAAVVGVSLGACIVEKHFCLTREIETADSKFSMDVNEFAEMVRAIRNVEKIKGNRSLPEDAAVLRDPRQGRSLFAVKDIAQGDVFTSENVRSIRPGYGLLPKYYEQLIGTKSKREIKRGYPILEEDLK